MHAVLLFILGCIPFQDSVRSANNSLTIAVFQDEKSAVITGQITDNKGAPLPYTTVFIANSTLGCISDENGMYRLDHVPYGQHILVVSYVGYKTHERKLVINTDEVKQDIHMTPLIVELEMVEVVERKSKSTWRSNYRKFKNCFLGTTPNVSACDILNPEVLRFHYDKESKVLTAGANEMLVIENKALAHHTLDQDGFRVIRTNAMIPFANQRQEKNKPEPKLSEEGDLIRSNTSMEYERMLLFSSAYMHVRYVYESDNLRGMGYQRTIDKMQPYQESWIQPLSTRTIFHENGYLYDPGSIMVFGYWAREKMAEALPLDYTPRQ